MKKLHVKKGIKSLALMAAASMALSGCNLQKDAAKTKVEMVQYKPEAAAYFEQLEKEFNASQDRIELDIQSPNDAMTVLKTRFIREDIPDIIGIGGDINYAYFVDADMLMDLSDYEGTKSIKPSYMQISKQLEIVPQEGIYGIPYAANAAGILYNREIFEAHNWEIPKTHDELLALCEDIKAAGITPFYFGFKDTWTCLAPWNSIAGGLTPADICQRVNQGEATFSEPYRPVAQMMLELLQYGQDEPFAYGYNDACTAFARGESAMYTIGSYAVPQIQSVNPDIQIDSFVMPMTNDPDNNILTSGVDLQFSVMKESKNKEAAYEVLDFLLQDTNIQKFVSAQNAVPCKEGNFELPPMLDGMKDTIEAGKVTDYQDHFYPSEMAADAIIQTFLIDKNVDAFLGRFDKEWPRYNRDIIAKIKKSEQ